MKKQRTGHFMLSLNYSILTDKKTCIQFLKFSAVGVFNTALQYGVFYLLYSIFGVYYLSASAIGYCVGMVNSFLLNKIWTFQTFSTRTEVEFIKFVLVNAFALAVNLGVLKIAVAGAGMRPEVGQIVAISFSTVTNFLGNKFWTFS